MSCTHVHDFISGTTLALPRPGARKLVRASQWEIVRPNQNAQRIVSRHLKALEALKARKRPKIAND